jgi:SulP family sulfate permease
MSLTNNSASWSWSLAFFRDVLFSLDIMKVWATGLGITTVIFCGRWLGATHPLFVPAVYLAVPVVFYSVFLSMGLSMEDARSSGWLFSIQDDACNTGDGSAGALRVDQDCSSKQDAIPFYAFWLLLDISKIAWKSVGHALPTILALAFFGVLHVPINVSLFDILLEGSL